MDPATGLVRLWGPGARFWGLASEGSIPVERWLEKVDAHDRGAVDSALHAAMDPTGAGNFAVSFCMADSDGERHAVTARGRTSFQGAGSQRRAVALVGMVMEVVEAPAEASAVRTLQRERADLLRVVSHDLRTPLTAILLQAQMLAQTSAAPADLRRAELIATSARRLNALIQELADMAHLESGHTQLSLGPLSLSRFVDGLRERLAGSLDVRRVDWCVPDNLPPVLADPDGLERIVGNLLANALRFSTPETRVTVAAELSDDSVALWVEDRGPGISPEDQQRLFQPFFRARTGARSDGLGLGLYIAALLVRAHGGTISVNSQPGQGSTFRVVLPRAR